MSVPMQLKGYVLEPPRVGGSNSPFTLSPNVVITNQDAFDAAYPADESVPRTEYMVQALREGPATGTGPGGVAVLPDATFGWTKNEGAVQEGIHVPFQRFGYAGQDQRFKPFQGAPREAVGTLSGESNSARLVVSAVPLLTDLAAFPVRISVGATGSGTTFVLERVSSFGSPPPLTVEMDATGALNWNADDLDTNLGAPVYYQRQSFYQLNETTGILGVLGTALLLNPLPATGQCPAIQIGSRRYLTTVECATEAAFSDPSEHTVEWALDTGRLNFSAADLATHSGQPVVYDGVFFGTFQVPTVLVGAAQSTPCGALSELPSESSDVHFRIPGLVQFPKTDFVDDFDPTGKQGHVQIQRFDSERGNRGAVQLSAADRAAYAAATVEAVLPDVLIERGISVRLFRSPVNPDGTAGVKDVTAFYTQTAATLAEPMVGQPFVFLPALPREGEDEEEDIGVLKVTVTQGTGSFLGELQRLDVADPPDGKGYTLDFGARQLAYAEHRHDQVLEISNVPNMVQLPGSPVHATGLTLALESARGNGNFVARVENRDFIIDRGSGVVTYVETEGFTILTGTATLSGPTLTVAGNLTGPETGDLVIIQSGYAEGVYELTEVATPTVTVRPSFPEKPLDTPNDVSYEIRRGREILADRFFREVLPFDPNTRVERINSLGTITNEPRLSINPAFASRVRFRFGKTRFSTAVVLLSPPPLETFFTTPGSLDQGHVEVDPTTGAINFSEADIAAGTAIYVSLTLRPGTEYNLQPVLGFIDLADRMLEREEVLVHYTTFSEDGATKIPIEERGTFLVSKELVQPHLTPTSTLHFNPTGRELASASTPIAYRGGRKQGSDRVTFNLTDSTVTFLPDSQVTDALPHGSSVLPSFVADGIPFENIHIDYQVHEALGGERNLTISRTPMATVRVVVDAGATAFTIEGDRTADFQPGLLEVDRSEVYLTSGSTFEAGVTTVSLDQTSPQCFRSDLVNPPLRVTSGAVRRFPDVFPAYLVIEEAAYDTVARGAKKLQLVGDYSRIYAQGSVVGFSDSLTFQDYYSVEAALFDSANLRTTLVLANGALRQYAMPTTLLKSLRPILGSSVATALTSRPPMLALPHVVYRQVEGQAGRILVLDRDYAIDDSGRVVLTDSLGLDEEIGILYTGASRIEAGRRTKASWTFTIVPSLDNGMLNQVLEMDYTAYLPDTFFYRVETFTNFRAEVADEIADEAKAASPSQGPVLENSGSTPLYEQGNPSLFFAEGDLSNQDLIARRTLQFYNNAINALESYFQGWDGRVVGDHDGRFMFDGNLDNPVRTHFAHATNQIDDLIQVFGSTPRRAFEAANYSRFYPTQKTRFGEATDPTGLATGDPIFDLQETALRSVTSVRTRSPWAVTTAAAPAGSTEFQVDHAEGDAYLLRPGLNVVPGLKVAMTTREGAVLVADGSPATVVSTTPNSVTLLAPVGVEVPEGATIRMALLDDVYRQIFNLGIDVGVDTDGGFLTHVRSDDVPVFFLPNSSPAAGAALDVTFQCGTTTSPARFPALDGGTTDDDGNRQFPALGVGGAELGAIEDELSLIDAATGRLEAVVTSSFVGAGTVTSSTTIDHGAAWLAPAPKVGDLVRILTGGTAGMSDYHRASAVGGSTLTLEPALDFSAGAVTFEITTGPVVASGSGTVSPTNVIFSAGGNFIVNGVQPGFTVVAVSGALVGERRQVTAVTATQLTVVSPFSSTGVIGYQVVNSLATYGGTASSLQDEWVLALSEQLRALEGQDLIDFSERIVEQATAHTITVSGIDMGAFQTLLVFVVVEAVDSGLSSLTFAGSPLTAQFATPSAQAFGLHVYAGEGLAGSGNLVVTATATAPNMKVFALKLSAMKSISVGTASVLTAPTTLGASGLSSVDAGDLVLNFLCSSSPGSRFYSLDGDETLIPLFNANGTSALLTATRASSAQQALSKQFRVVGTTGTTRIATVVLTKDPSADMIPGRAVPERVALQRFLVDATPELIPAAAIDEARVALENVEAAIVSAGNQRLLHECPILVYRNASTVDSSFTRTAGRLVLGGAYARAISSLTTREAALAVRTANSIEALQNILSSGRLYDGRFVWIDSRINLETGILPKKDRAVANRQKALETTVKNLTKLLSL